jgi:hypothetical protein
MLDISAIVLANLCVCYILTNSNEEAEEVMKRVEKEEMVQSDRKSFHLCIINLVIGTLYCAKVSRILFNTLSILRAILNLAYLVLFEHSIHVIESLE